MATFAQNTQLTTLELSKRETNGDINVIAEVLDRMIMLFKDLPMLEANDRFSNQSTIRTQLPGGATRRLNEGVVSTSSLTEKIIDTIEFLEAWSDIDEIIVDSSPNPAMTRAQEAIAFLEGMAQTIGTQYIYGNNKTDGDSMTGLSPRMASLGDTVLGASGTGSDLSSIYFVRPGVSSMHGIYPRGSTVGITRDNKGKRTKETGSNARLDVYSEKFQAFFGLVVKDLRSIGRLANIESAGTTNQFDHNLVINIQAQMMRGGQSIVGYANRTVWAQIMNDAVDKSNAFLTLRDVFGDGVLPMINGIPIRMDESIVNTEAAITA